MGESSHAACTQCTDFKDAMKTCIAPSHALRSFHSFLLYCPGTQYIVFRRYGSKLQFCRRCLSLRLLWRSLHWPSSTGIIFPVWAETARGKNTARLQPSSYVQNQCGLVGVLRNSPLGPQPMVSASLWQGLSPVKDGAVTIHMVSVLITVLEKLRFVRSHS